MHPKLGSATLSQLAFPGEGNPNFPWEKSHGDNTVVKSYIKEYIIVQLNFFSFLFSSTDACVYKNVAYRQGENWEDGCDYVCVCDNEATGDYTCTSK